MECNVAVGLDRLTFDTDANDIERIRVALGLRLFQVALGEQIFSVPLYFTDNSVPHPYARHEANLARITPFSPNKVGGVGETPVKRDADIGGELAPNLIAQAESKLDVVQTSAGCEPLDSLNCGIGLKARLKNQPLRQEIIFCDREPRRNITPMTDE